MSAFPRAIEWNAYRREGQVFVRFAATDSGAEHLFWDQLQRYLNRGLIESAEVEEAKVLPAYLAHASEGATLLLLRPTEKGRASLAVALTQLDGYL